MRIWIAAICSTAALWLVGASSATAVTIDCASLGSDCVGGVYDLTIDETAPDVYLATYKIDTSGAFKVAATHLVDIEFKAAKDYIDPISITMGPSGIVEAGPLSGGGCNGSNGGFICVNLDPDVAVGDVYTWKIQFGATGLLDESEWHIGARYTSPDHQKGWVISETAAPVPEPSAAMVFGVGMLLAGRASMRRRVLA
jgi:hypothetical protein